MLPVAWKIADQTWQLYLIQDNVFGEGILNIQANKSKQYYKVCLRMRNPYDELTVPLIILVCSANWFFS